MTHAYAIEVFGETIGIVAAEKGAKSFRFHSAHRAFHAMEGQSFAHPRDAEKAAQRLLSRKGKSSSKALLELQ